MRARLSALLLSSMLAVLLPHPAARATQQPSGERTGDVIVRFHAGASLADVGQALAASDTAAVKSGSPSIAVVRPEGGQSVDAAVDALSAHPRVDYAEPDLRVTIAATPNDPQYGSQWHYPNAHLPAAWDVTTGSSSVIIAVVDTGVQLNHPELDSKITSGANAGYDFVNADTSPNDDNGHGTHVAGTIGAETNNSVGVAGVCWACKIMPVKVLDATGNGSVADVAAGMDWARAHGAHVINVSLGTLGNSITLQNAVDAAWNAGVIVVGASGNYADDGDTTNDGVLYPAAYANAIAVGAHGASGLRASFSNYGPALDVTAPGVDVRSTMIPGTYSTESGTSMATPHVAGIVGLMIANGITDKNTIRNRLTSTATDAGAAGFDHFYGHGRVNAEAAVSLTSTYAVSWGADTTPASMSTGATVNPTISFMNSGTLTWSASGANPVRLSYHWRNGACPGASSAIWNGLRTALPADVAAGGAVSGLAATVTAPSSAGTFCLVYDLVREGIAWFSAQGAATKQKTVTVNEPAYGIAWGADDTTPSSMAAGATANPQLTFTNTGSLTWNAGGTNPVRLGYHWRNGACPGSGSAVWNGVRTALPGDVPSGGIVSGLAAKVTAPSSAGTYCLVYDLVREGVTWFSSQGAATRTKTVTVTSPVYGVTWGADATPSSVTAGATFTTTISFTNAGSLSWSAGGANSVRLSYHWKSGACPGGGMSVWNGVRTLLPGDVASGSTVSSLSVTIVAPGTTGTYCLVYDMVREGVTWFSSQGAATLTRTVTVN